MRIYLDYLSACPVLPEVREAMRPFLAEQFGNPSALHQGGLQARAAIKAARGQIAGLIHAETPENIIFTGNGTEAVNLAVKGAALAAARTGKHVVLSAIEQPSISKSVGWLETQGFSCTKIPVDSAGRMDLGAFEAALRPETTLACVHHGHADLGTVQDLKRIGEITRRRGVALFVDATASAGWIELDVQAVQADLVALAPHRFYGPKGVGVLYRHRRARLVPLIHGGEQEEGRRAGTENVAGIVGAGQAAEIAARELIVRQGHTRSLQATFLMGIAKTLPHWRLNGLPPGVERMPNSLNLSIEFVEGEGLALMLDVKGVAIASGAACVAKSMRVPPALAAIRWPSMAWTDRALCSRSIQTKSTLGAIASVTVGSESEMPTPSTISPARSFSRIRWM